VDQEPTEGDGVADAFDLPARARTACSNSSRAAGTSPRPGAVKNVWVAGEWGAGTKSDTAKWSTAIGQYTFQPPIVEYN
jgi:hypothetical protein